MPKKRMGERRQDILETLTGMLQERQGEPITTASLAAAVGVSEAALYRHFPSKAKMFEALIEFIEETIFSRITRILADEPAADLRLQQIINLVLGFADKNPGMTYLLQGGILIGETARLRMRITQIFERIETQIKQILREGEITGCLKQPVSEISNLFLALMEGRLTRFVRQEFRLSPLLGWNEQWELLRPTCFISKID